MIDFLAKIQYLLIYQLIGTLKENSNKKLYFLASSGLVEAGYLTFCEGVLEYSEIKVGIISIPNRVEPRANSRPYML